MLRYICLFSVSISQLWSADLPALEAYPRVKTHITESEHRRDRITEQKRPDLLRNAPHLLVRPHLKKTTKQLEFNRYSIDDLLIFLEKGEEALESGEISRSEYEHIFSVNYNLLLDCFQTLCDELSGGCDDSPELLSSCIEASEEAERAERSTAFTKNKKSQSTLRGYRAFFLKKAADVDRILKNNTKQPEFDRRLFDDMQAFLKENKAVLTLSELSEISKIVNEKIVRSNFRMLLSYFQGRYKKFSKLPASPDLLSSCIREAQKAKLAEESFGVTKDNWRLHQLRGCRAMLLIEAAYIARQLTNNTEQYELAEEALGVLNKFPKGHDHLVVFPDGSSLIARADLRRLCTSAKDRATTYLKKENNTAS